MIVSWLAAGALALVACTDQSSTTASTTGVTANPGGSPTEASTTASSVPPADALVTGEVTDDAVAAAVATIDDTVTSLMSDTGVPGVAVAVVHQGEVVLSKGYGTRDINTGEPVTGDTVFQLASLSKPIGATVISSLVDQGVVAWDDPVVRHLPEFALSDEWIAEHVTIADLYSHRSGLPDHVGNLLEMLGYDRDAIVERMAVEPLAPFRSTYAYTNMGLTVGAEAVAAAAGTSWADISRRVLYEPLGMSSTSSRYSDYLAADDRASLHVRDGDDWQVSSPFDTDVESPAGGVSSSAADMAQWMRLQLGDGTVDGKEIIGVDALTQMRTPHSLMQPLATSDARSVFYGLGIGVRTDSTGRVHLSHSGAFSNGASTAFALVPSEQLGIVVLSNSIPIGLVETVVNDFLDRAINGAPTRDWFAELAAQFAALLGEDEPTDPSVSDGTPARDLNEYTGTYANDYFGALVVSIDNGDLVVTVREPGSRLLMDSLGGDRFSFTSDRDSTLTAPGVFEFHDGEAVGLTIEAFGYEVPERGQFVRQGDAG